MYNYTTDSYLGYTIHVVTVKADSTHDAQLSVMALRYDDPNVIKTTINWHDNYLESNGWTRIAAINGGIFNSQYEPIIFANGIEKAYGVVNENDDTSLDTVMAFAHTGKNSNNIILNTQAAIKSTLYDYRGAITGAFGLLKDGVVYQGNTSLQGSYSSKSGRSMIGNTVDGTIYFISVAGVTGSTGLTGSQLLSYAKSLNLYNAIAMDGGGSVGLVYEDEWKVNSSRLVKNAIGIYIKNKNINQFYTKVNGSIKEVSDIKVKVNGNLKTVNKIIYKDSNGNLKNIYEI